jgi:class 3 adenylate cyclase/tetratricopeptide (TPR) repeat protein
VTTQDERRKTVTVLFCDLAGSTALGESVDPERLRTILAAYFECMKTIVERHGGTVEKFIGDAVMAVFGVPSVHEDDALRAVRAAAEMRDALPGLGLEGRIGVTTGEVVTGTEERLATGDAVNVAARLEQAAASGEVLIGEPTLRLVRDAVDVDPVEPLSLKGKSEQISAYRLVTVREALERPHAARFVGRERELALLREAWERAQLERRCELVTIVGEAGVGKSRLVAELLSSVGETVLRGRCLPYGEGITYWAIVEMLKQLDLVPSDELAAAAIRSLLGDSEAATSPEEIAWAFRKTLEQAAAEHPLIAVLDDIQWGDETLHNLIEHVSLLSTGSAILLICMARRELVEHRPTWPVTLRLEPLVEGEVEALLADRVPETMRDRIMRAAGGNPLFVEEMVAVSRERDGDIAVPPTLQALLAARLDQLDPAERHVLERAAVEGETFHRSAVRALSPEEGEVTPHLAALVRKQLIIPDRPQLAGEDGFRFRHLLIRDAAYDGLPKSVRATLHADYAAWLEQHGGSMVELDELLGYHLEQAHTYRVEVGLPDDASLAAAARGRLTAAGSRALSRQDFGAAARLLGRAVALLPSTEIDVPLELHLTEALMNAGRGGEALRQAESLAARAAERGDRVGELCGQLQHGIILTYIAPEGATEQLEALAGDALPELLEAGNDLALHSVYQARGWVAFLRGRTDSARDAYDLAARYARPASLVDEHLGWRSICRLYGTTPIPELLAWLDDTESRAGHDHWHRTSRAMALAWQGRFDDARTLLSGTRAELADRGASILLGGVTAIESNMVEQLAGDADAAAEFGAEGCRILELLGDEAFLSSAASWLAQALYRLDRLDEADSWASRAADLGASDDVFNQMNWRPVKAKVLARRGDRQDAERLAREAVAIAETTDDPNGQGDVYADLAEVLELGGRPTEAREALEQALQRYEGKGNVVSAARVRRRLRELEPAV